MAYGIPFDDLAGHNVRCSGFVDRWVQTKQSSPCAHVALLAHTDHRDMQVQKQNGDRKQYEGCKIMFKCK